MNMRWLSIVQIVVSILLTATILLQQRGSSLGATFGGEGTVFRTKRGIEKSLFLATIILAILFIASSLYGLFL